MEENKNIIQFKITNDKLKMEIKLSDLVWLFNTDPQNFDGEQPMGKIRPGMRKEFAQYLIDKLQDFKSMDSDDPRMGQVFTDIFDEILSGDEPFVKYYSQEN